MSDAQFAFLWQAARPEGKAASPAHPVGISLEARGLALDGGGYAPLPFKTIWIATEAGRAWLEARSEETTTA